MTTDTTHPDLLRAEESPLLRALKEPFHPRAISWRVGKVSKGQGGAPSRGMALAYIDARDVMKRLDDVCGAEWQCRYPYPGCCEIGIKIDGEWIWKADGAGQSDIEAEKGQYSDSFKRAAVRWGIGRYLYYLPSPWVELVNDKFLPKDFNPVLPEWAHPGYVPPSKK